MKGRHRNLVLGIILALNLVTAAFSAEQYLKPGVIPGLEKPFPSPDGRLELLYRSSENNPNSLPHEIWIRSTRNPKDQTLLYSMGRNGNVLWSPDSTMVAITDAASSTDSFVLVFRVLSPTTFEEVKEVRQVLDQKFFNNSRIYGDHRYAKVVRWSRDSKSLLVELRAHGDVGKEFRGTLTLRIPQKR